MISRGDASSSRPARNSGKQRKWAASFTQLFGVGSPPLSSTLSQDAPLPVFTFVADAEPGLALASTNPIESCLPTVEKVARNVKRWREGEQALRWRAMGLLEAQKKFRRVNGYRELELLRRRLNSWLTQ